MSEIEQKVVSPQKHGANIRRKTESPKVFGEKVGEKFVSLGKSAYLCSVRMSSEGAKQHARGARFQAGPF